MGQWEGRKGEAEQWHLPESVTGGDELEGKGRGALYMEAMRG